MKTVTRIALMSLMMLGLARSADAQVIISLLLGDKLNSGKVEFGLDGGWNFSSQSGQSKTGIYSTFNLGFYFDIKLKKEPWMIHTGVIVKSNMGTGNLPVYSLGDPNLDNTFAGGSVERNLNYFNVPIFIKYKFNEHFYAEGGPMLGLLYGAHDIFTNSVQGNEARYERNIRSDYHPLDAGIVFGLGYRLLGGNGMNLGLRYYYGVVDVVVDDSSPDVYNRSLYVTLGIPIGVGKAKEKGNFDDK